MQSQENSMHTDYISTGVYQPLSESPSMINRKSPPSSRKKSLPKFAKIRAAKSLAEFAFG